MEQQQSASQETQGRKRKAEDGSADESKEGRRRRCRHWAQKGLCQLGESCQFLHSGLAGKSIPCRHFARGYCRLGAVCDFGHGAPIMPAPGFGFAPPPPRFLPSNGGPPLMHAAYPPRPSFSGSPYPAPPPPLPSQPLQDRKPCRHWLRGHCQLGMQCGFGHNPDQFGSDSGHAGPSGGLSGGPSGVPSGVQSGIQSGGRKICRHFARGACWQGDSCNFLHTHALLPGP